MHNTKGASPTQNLQSQKHSYGLAIVWITSRHVQCCEQLVSECHCNLFTTGLLSNCLRRLSEEEWWCRFQCISAPCYTTVVKVSASFVKRTCWLFCAATESVYCLPFAARASRTTTGVTSSPSVNPRISLKICGSCRSQAQSASHALKADCDNSKLC